MNRASWPGRLILCLTALRLTVAWGQAPAGNSAPIVHNLAPVVARPVTNLPDWETLPSDDPRFPLTPPVEYTAPPLSLARVSADGLLYDRGVNRIYDVADRVSSGTNETWLATGYGVKCVDHRAGVMRHYTPDDGLPGTDVAAIAADAQAVWCLVRLPEPPKENLQEGRLHLCVFDAGATRWQDKCTIRGHEGGGNPFIQNAARSARTLLALSERYAAVVSQTITSDDAAFVTLLDRQSGVVTELPWDPLLHADVDPIQATALSVDDGGVWMGTPAGLLRWDFATKAWRRLMPDRIVDCGASAGSEALWVVEHPRFRTIGADYRKTNWRLTRIDAANRKEEHWSLPAGQETYGGLSYGNLRDELPLALFVADDGAVWTATRWPFDPRSTGTGGYGVGGISARQDWGGGWLRFDPATAAWKGYLAHWILTPVTGGRGARWTFGAASLNFQDSTPDDLDFPTGQPKNAPQMPFTVVPAGAVRPLALCPRSRPTNDALFWIQHRFPEWLCLDPHEEGGNQTAAGAQPTPPPIKPGVTAKKLPAVLPDPDNRDKAWTISGDDHTIRYGDHDDMVTLQKRRDTQEDPAGEALRAKPLGESESFSPPTTVIGRDGKASALLTMVRDVTALKPLRGDAAGGSQPGLMATTREGAFGLNTQTGALTPLQVFGRTTVYDRVRAMFADPVQPGLRLLFGMDSTNGDAVGRFDLAAKTLTLAGGRELPPKTTLIGIGGSDGGVWVQLESRELAYLPGFLLGQWKSDSVPKENCVPASSSDRVWAGETGSIYWRLDAKSRHLVGWDGILRRQIAESPVAVLADRPLTGVLTDSAGMVYLAGAGGQGGFVWRYDAEHDRWLALAPAPTLPANSASGAAARPAMAQFAGITVQAIFVLVDNARLYRYDRRQKRWDAPVEIPETLRTAAAFHPLCATVLDGVVYAGGVSGLFRLALNPVGRLPSGPHWTSLPVTLPLAAGPEISGLPAGGTWTITDIALQEPVGERAVYAILQRSGAAFGGRLDDNTRHWTFYDETKGFPTQLGELHFLDSAHGTWIASQFGIYHLDMPAGRWRQVFVVDPVRTTYQGGSEGAGFVSVNPPTPFAPGIVSESGLPEISANFQMAYGNGVTDFFAPAATTSGGGREYRWTLFRLRDTDGSEIERVPYPTANYVRAAGIAEIPSGAFWTSVNAELYRASADSYTTPPQWSRITPPEIPEGALIQQLQAQGYGALWIVTDNSALLWRTAP